MNTVIIPTCDEVDATFLVMELRISSLLSPDAFAKTFYSEQQDQWYVIIEKKS